MKTIRLKCKCGKYFNKPLKEYTRQLKKNPDYIFYCNKSCFGKFVSINNCKPYQGSCTNNLKRGSSKDIYSPFREIFRRVKRRNHQFDITLKYLKELNS